MKNVILYLTFIGIAMTPIKTLAQDNTLTNQEKNEVGNYCGTERQQMAGEVPESPLSRRRDGKLSAMIYSRKK